jgi:dTDP-4-dehydrorhamnose reductase
MNVLITGANGFIGFYLTQNFLERNFMVIATGKAKCRLPFTNHSNFIYAEMDFTNPYSVDEVFNQYKPDVVIHADAMGKPDECEQNQMKAYLVNVEGTVHLLMNAAEHKSFFVFLSTDFVFDGTTGMYKEEDARRPVN